MGSHSFSSADLSRRSFLRARPRGDTAPLRPPWSLSETAFIERCTRCGVCIERCETGLLHKGSGGFPEARFDSGGCNACGECVRVCTPGAIRRGEGSPPWDHKANIGDACLARQKVVCRTCGEHCEAGAIRFRLEKGGVALPRLDPSLCNGCGMCVASCPSRAIHFRSVESLEETLS